MKIRTAANEDLERIVHLFGQLGYSTEPEQVEKQLHALRFPRTGICSGGLPQHCRSRDSAHLEAVTCRRLMGSTICVGGR